MQSHEVLKKAVTNIGAKAVAADMSLSSSLIYKWCEPKDKPDAAGADNPLDRIHRIYELTDDPGPIKWLCQKAGGFFVKNAPPSRESDSMSLLIATQQILKEFSELLTTMSESVEDDGQVDNKEAKRIRAEWEDLKAIAEGFVAACEQGLYHKTGRA